MHPHKIQGFDFRGDNEVIDFDAYSKEMSGRLSSMAKRNVIFTSTFEAPVRQSELGIPDQINHAVIEDSSAYLFNISGDIKKNQDAFDGSSFMEATYSMMLDKSYPQKGYEGTKKQFGTLITPHGVTIKKDAESVITNDKILKSKNSKVSFLNKKKQMLSQDISDVMMDLNLEFADGEFNYNYLGKIHSIYNFKINGNSYELWTRNENGIAQPVIKGRLTTLFDLWKLFGGEYSTDNKGEFNEGSNELLYQVITSQDREGKYPLKNRMIHVISSLSAVKAGASNVNGSDAWTGDTNLAFTSFNSRFMGPQLDANHHVDDSEIKEVTQVVSALAQNGFTAEIAREAYKSIENVIKTTANDYLKYMRPRSNVDKDGLYDYVAKKFLSTIEHSSGDNIAKTLVDSFKEDNRIPFSNPNFYGSFVKDVITRMNDEFITRHYSGTGAILIPSHGIIQLYDLIDKNGNKYTITQDELIQEALENYDSNKYLTPTDKVVYGHNALGKSFLFAKGRSRFVSLDDDFKPEIDKFIDEHRGELSRQDYKAMHPEDYNNLLLELWEQTKEKAKNEGKIAIVSNHHILRQRPQDFNKVITLPKEEFRRRLIQRGMDETQLEKDLEE